MLPQMSPFFSTEDADQIFRDAARLNMTGAGYVWIVTEQVWESPLQHS